MVTAPVRTSPMACLRRDRCVPFSPYILCYTSIFVLQAVVSQRWMPGVKAEEGTWATAKSHEELSLSYDPWMSEWG